MNDSEILSLPNVVSIVDSSASAQFHQPATESANGNLDNGNLNGHGTKKLTSVLGKLLERFKERIHVPDSHPESATPQEVFIKEAKKRVNRKKQRQSPSNGEDQTPNHEAEAISKISRRRKRKDIKTAATQYLKPTSIDTTSVDSDVIPANSFKRLFCGLQKNLSLLKLSPETTLRTTTNASDDAIPEIMEVPFMPSPAITPIRNLILARQDDARSKLTIVPEHHESANLSPILQPSPPSPSPSDCLTSLQSSSLKRTSRAFPSARGLSLPSPRPDSYGSVNSEATLWQISWSRNMGGRRWTDPFGSLPRSVISDGSTLGRNGWCPPVVKSRKTLTDLDGDVLGLVLVWVMEGTVEGIDGYGHKKIAVALELAHGLLTLSSRFHAAVHAHVLPFLLFRAFGIQGTAVDLVAAIRWDCFKGHDSFDVACVEAVSAIEGDIDEVVGDACLDGSHVWWVSGFPVGLVSLELGASGGCLGMARSPVPGRLRSVRSCESLESVVWVRPRTGVQVDGEKESVRESVKEREDSVVRHIEFPKQLVRISRRTRSMFLPLNVWRPAPGIGMEIAYGLGGGSGNVSPGGCGPMTPSPSISSFASYSSSFRSQRSGLTGPAVVVGREMHRVVVSPFGGSAFHPARRGSSQTISSIDSPSTALTTIEPSTGGDSSSVVCGDRMYVAFEGDEMFSPFGASAASMANAASPSPLVLAYALAVDMPPKMIWSIPNSGGDRALMPCANEDVVCWVEGRIGGGREAILNARGGGEVSRVRVVDARTGLGRGVVDIGEDAFVRAIAVTRSHLVIVGVPKRLGVEHATKQTPLRPLLVLMYRLVDLVKVDSFVLTSVVVPVNGGVKLNVHVGEGDRDIYVWTEEEVVKLTPGAGIKVFARGDEEDEGKGKAGVVIGSAMRGGDIGGFWVFQNGNGAEKKCVWFRKPV
ncbi:hypothetical protein HDU97_007935 [Phlyctochytrium planicorne]|nr:hypothetical protein HDU97_007935 [Phlyctochytrium planicorne]